VIGTTGFTQAEEAELARLAHQTVIVLSGNMSPGVIKLAGLVRDATRTLPHYDVEVVEMHHREKANIREINK
jgi:4-hydroxy-tetrahydrodipicolinate reductase